MKKVFVMLVMSLVIVMLLSTAVLAAPAAKEHDITSKVDVTFLEQGDSTEVTVMLPKVGSSLAALKITKVKPSAANKEIDFFDTDFNWNTGEWDTANHTYYWGTVSYDEETEMYTIVLHFDGDNVSDIKVYAKFSSGGSLQTHVCDGTWPVEY